jgi:hypothetical protein
VKTRTFAISAAAVMALSTPLAFASTGPAQGSDPLVWVARDITRQSHFTLEYRHYDRQGHFLGKETVLPPTGSLVEYVKVPLSEAIAKGEDYVAADSAADLSDKLEALHEKLFEKLHGKGATLASVQAAELQASAAQPMSTPPDTATDVIGTFTDFHGTTWWYDISYNTFNYPTITVTQYELYQQSGSGTSYLDHLTWNTSTRYYGSVIPTSAPQIFFQGSWTNPPGYAFKTFVVKNNVTYSGWATLS